MTSIAIGVVPRERFSLVGQTIERILECTPEPFQLVVVDAGTPPRYRADIDRALDGRDDVVRLVTDEIVLPNRARNMVLDHVDADWVALVENDLLVEPEWLSKLIAACEAEDAGAAVPLIIERFGPYRGVHFDDRLHTIVEVQTPDGPGLRIDARPDAKGDDPGSARRRVEFIETHCMLFTRDALARTGLFDAEITAQEEMDISLSLHAHGIPAVFEPDAVVEFFPPPPIEPEEREYYLRKWDPVTYAEDYERVAERWRLVDAPSAMGVVQTRRSFAKEPDPQRQVDAQLAYRRRLSDTADDLATVAGDGGTMILVHDEQLNLGVVAQGLDVLPFTERDGVAWGPPADDAAAIAEVERMRSEGATSIVIAWPCFWWLDHYTGFVEHLRSSYRQILDNDRLLGFDLTAGAARRRDEDA